MKKKFMRAAVAAVGLGLAAGAVAQMTAEDMIKTRQSGYTYMSWNLGIIKSLAVDGAAPYDQARVARAADAIAGIANSNMGELYAPGTDKGTGWKPTRLDPSFFDELDKVGEIAINFVEQANRMQEVAHSGDKQAVAAQFRELAGSCKACHDNYRLPN
ncbi:MAG: cytochrome c [Bacteroidales bacterium]|nr:cytochrome c [Bacteroidales bacterium]